MQPDLAHERIDYDSVRLEESESPEDPLELFQSWLTAALAAQELGKVGEPTAMNLATVIKVGDVVKPDARMVLLKSFDGEGFTFFTNYASSKGEQLARNPHAAATFWWASLHRQIRIAGTVAKVSREASEAYFATRPRASQLGAWCSPQSRRVPSAEALTEAFAAARERFEGHEIECPAEWGGYRLVSNRIEFWQGRPSRMHDRLVYSRVRTGGTDTWDRYRLAP